MKLVRTKRILVAVDFTNTSWTSFKVSAFLATTIGFEVHIIHVLPTSSTPLLDILQKDREDKKDISAYYAECSIKLKSKAREVFKSGPRLKGRLKLRTIVTSGNASRQIIQAINDIQPDFVVIGTHRSAEFFSVITGGCAERVIQGASRPVLVVPKEMDMELLFTKTGSQQQKSQERPPLKILLPTDYSEPSRQALDYALDICQFLNGKLSVLHVIEKPGGVEAGGPDDKFEPESVVRSQELDAFLAREMTSERGPAIEAFVRFGNPVDEILDFSSREGIQMIVMGTRGRHWVERLLLGSTIESVISRAHCPVLAVQGVTKIDDIEKKYQRIRERLTPYVLQTNRPMPPKRAEKSKPTRLEIKELPEQLSRLFLGYYSPDGLKNGIEQYGISELLKNRGFADLTYVVDTRNPFQQTVRIINGEKDDRSNLLIEFSLHEEAHPSQKIIGPTMKSQHFHFLVVDWVLLQNPRRTRFSNDRPRLPGQTKPGLGMGYEIFGIFTMATERLKKDGLLARPEHYHNAFLYHERCLFASPETEGIFRAITRDTAQYTLPEISWAIEKGFLLDREGHPFVWRGEDLIMPRHELLREFFDSTPYLGGVRQAMSRHHFRLDWGNFKVMKDQFMLPRKTS